MCSFLVNFSTASCSISTKKTKVQLLWYVKEWYEKDSTTRKHVTIAMSYSTKLRRPDQQFPNLQSLNLKGKPRASMFDFVPKDWGGFVTPWVQEIEDHVTIAMSYSTTLRRPDQGFPNLQSLKLKGKPRASMYDFVPKDWGGFVTPWVQEMEDHFAFLNSLHLHRIVVSDDDLRILADSRSMTLFSLKLDVCTDFTTNGLKLICHSCNKFFLFMDNNNK